MRKTWLARVNTLVLAFLVAGGGSGLPVVDALVHHLHGSRQLGTRVGDGEAPASHAERCALGVPLPVMASAGSVASLPSVAARPHAPPAACRPASEPSTFVAAAARPRAPPLRIG